jgi:hypothetical protein
VSCRPGRCSCWRQNLLKSALVAALVVCSTGYNPLSPSEMVGDWSGRDLPLHFAYVEMRFQRNGSAVSGTACRYDGDLLSFTGVPVTVDGTRVTFAAYPATSTEQVFEGRFTDDDTLKGAWTGHPSQEIVLKRGGNFCANAH